MYPIDSEQDAWKKIAPVSLIPGNLELGLIKYFLVILKVVGFELYKAWKQLAATLYHVGWEAENQLLVKGKNTTEVEREDPYWFHKGTVGIKWDHGY